MDRFGEIENAWNIKRATQYVEASPYFEKFYRHYMDRGNVREFLRVTKLGEAGFTSEDVNAWLFGATVDGVEEAVYNPLGLQRIVESMMYYGLSPKSMTRLVSVDGHTVAVKWLNTTIPFMNVSSWKITGLTTKIAFHEKPGPHADFFTIEVWMDQLKADQIPTILSISTSIGVDRRQRGVPKGYRIKAECHFVGATIGTMRTIYQYLDGRVSKEKLSETYDRNVIQMAQELSSIEEKMDKWIGNNPGKLYPPEKYWKELELTHGYGEQITITPPEEIAPALSLPEESVGETFSGCCDDEEVHGECSISGRYGKKRGGKSRGMSHDKKKGKGKNHHTKYWGAM